MKKRAVSLLSGGMDSLVTMAIALKDYEVFPLHLNYRNRTEAKELECFNKICAFYGLERKLIVDVDYLRQIGGSSLTDFTIEPENTEPSKGSIPSTYVPFRNANLLSIAVSYAEVIGAERIFIGAVEPDGSGYPDCRSEFIEAFNAMIVKGSKAASGIKVEAPVIGMTKKDIVVLGTKLNVPFHLTWSCYRNSDRACGKCQSCNLRLKGFAGAKVKDPIEYE